MDMKEPRSKIIIKVISLSVSILMLWQGLVWANPEIFSKSKTTLQPLTLRARGDYSIWFVKSLLVSLEKTEKNITNQNFSQVANIVKSEIRAMLAIKTGEAETHDFHSKLFALFSDIETQEKHRFYRKFFLIDMGVFCIRYYFSEDVRDPGDQYQVISDEKIGRYLYKQLLLKREFSDDGIIKKEAAYRLYEALVTHPKEEPVPKKEQDTIFFDGEMVKAMDTDRYLIEDATVSDAEVISEMYRNSINLEDMSPSRLIKIISQGKIGENQNTYLKVCRDRQSGKVAGYIFAIDGENGQGNVYIKHLVISTWYRRQYVAQTLLMDMCRTMQTKSYESCTILPIYPAVTDITKFLGFKWDRNIAMFRKTFEENSWDGCIARGDSDELFKRFEDMFKVKGTIKPLRDSFRDGLSEAIDEIKARLEKMEESIPRRDNQWRGSIKIANDEIEKILKNIRSDRVVEFRGIVLPSDYLNIKPKEWLLGFNTIGLDLDEKYEQKGMRALRQRINKLVPGAIGLSSQVLDIMESRPAGSVVQEFLFHEIICPRIGHRLSRVFQEELFPENYQRLWTSGKGGYKDGILGHMLKEVIIDENKKTKKRDRDRKQKRVKRAKKKLSKVEAGEKKPVREKPGNGIVLRKKTSPARIKWIKNKFFPNAKDDQYAIGGAPLFEEAIFYYSFAVSGIHMANLTNVYFAAFLVALRILFYFLHTDKDNKKTERTWFEKCGIPFIMTIIGVLVVLVPFIYPVTAGAEATFIKSATGMLIFTHSLLNCFAVNAGWSPANVLNFFGPKIPATSKDVLRFMERIFGKFKLKGKNFLEIGFVDREDYVSDLRDAGVNVTRIESASLSAHLFKFKKYSFQTVFMHQMPGEMADEVKVVKTFRGVARIMDIQGRLVIFDEEIKKHTRKSIEKVLSQAGLRIESMSKYPGVLVVCKDTMLEYRMWKLLEKWLDLLENDGYDIEEVSDTLLEREYGHAITHYLLGKVLNIVRDKGMTPFAEKIIEFILVVNKSVNVSGMRLFFKFLNSAKPAKVEIASFIIKGMGMKAVSHLVSEGSGKKSEYKRDLYLGLLAHVVAENLNVTRLAAYYKKVKHPRKKKFFVEAMVAAGEKLVKKIKHKRKVASEIIITTESYNEKIYMEEFMGYSGELLNDIAAERDRAAKVLKPGVILKLQKWFAPHMSPEKYAVKRAPWIEEGIFFMLPALAAEGINYWVRWGGWGTLVLISLSRILLFFLHEGARGNAPPKEYIVPLIVAALGFVYAMLVPQVALSGVLNMFFILTLFFAIGYTHYSLNKFALHTGIPPASIAKSNSRHKTSYLVLCLEDVVKGSKGKERQVLSINGAVSEEDIYSLLQKGIFVTNVKLSQIDDPDSELLRNGYFDVTVIKDFGEANNRRGEVWKYIFQSLKPSGLVVVTDKQIFDESVADETLDLSALVAKLYNSSSKVWLIKKKRSFSSREIRNIDEELYRL